MEIRLEYSPTEGKFKQSQAEDPADNIKDYKTLCCFVNVERATRFTQAIQIKYPELSSAANQGFPSFSIIKNELYQFMAEDIKALEQHMDITYKRRANLLK